MTQDAVDLRRIYEAGEEFSYRGIEFQPTATGCAGQEGVLQGELGVDMDRRWGFVLELGSDGFFRAYRYPDLVLVRTSAKPWSFDGLAGIIEGLKKS